MPSFDIVCSAEPQEIRNGVDIAKREVTTRFDLKDSGTEIEIQDGKGIQIDADNEFFVRTVTDIVIGKLVKRGVDPLFFEAKPIEMSPSGKAKRLLEQKEGIPRDVAKEIIQAIKDTKIKVQTAIQGDEIRVSGKKKDDLQAAIQALKQASFDRPLSFSNFRE